jgi:hypothetical protein
MAAALPHIDDFLPANNLRSLEALATLLGAIPPTRPLRHQHTLAQVPDALQPAPP